MITYKEKTIYTYSTYLYCLKHQTYPDKLSLVSSPSGKARNFSELNLRDRSKLDKFANDNAQAIIDWVATQPQI